MDRVNLWMLFTDASRPKAKKREGRGGGGGGKTRKGHEDNKTRVVSERENERHPRMLSTRPALRLLSL